MTEATGFEAQTIHRLDQVDPKGGGFKRATTTIRSTVTCWWSMRPSMVDVMLMQALMKARHPAAGQGGAVGYPGAGGGCRACVGIGRKVRPVIVARRANCNKL